VNTEAINISIVSELLLEDVLNCVLYENGIIEIFWDTRIEVIEIVHLKHVQQSLEKLGKGKKMPIFFTAHDFLTVSSDARLFAASEEGTIYTLANAVLIDSLPKKLLFNFFINFNKPIAPTRGFTSKREAFDWLTAKLNEISVAD